MHGIPFHCLNKAFVFIGCKGTKVEHTFVMAQRPGYIDYILQLLAGEMIQFHVTRPSAMVWFIKPV